VNADIGKLIELIYAEANDFLAYRKSSFFSDACQETEKEWLVLEAFFMANVLETARKYGTVADMKSRVDYYEGMYKLFCLDESFLFLMTGQEIVDQKVHLGGRKYIRLSAKSINYCLKDMYGKGIRECKHQNYSYVEKLNAEGDMGIELAKKHKILNEQDLADLVNATLGILNDLAMMIIFLREEDLGKLVGNISIQYLSGKTLFDGSLDADDRELVYMPNEVKYPIRYVLKNLSNRYLVGG
jgi:hypothetical protein